MSGFAIAVFSRPPIAGATKTRLIPALGAEAAARLHRQLLERTVRTAHATGATVILQVTDAPGHDAFAALAARYGCAIALQHGEDLGARMLHALEAMLARHDRALLIGSDCAVHTPQSLQAAADALAAHDMVFTPAEDGGYVLVGAHNVAPAAFSQIAWGTGEVMAQTRQRLAACRCTWREMPTLWDIDEPADVQRAQSCGLLDALYD
jgi:uncharacterized protein